MDTVGETRSLGGRIAIALYAVAALGMSAALVFLVIMVTGPTGTGFGEGFPMIVSLAALLVAVLCFALSMLLEPHRRRALLMAASGVAYVAILVCGLLLRSHIPFWPRFMTHGF
jgi:hypothetical protein